MRAGARGPNHRAVALLDRWLFRSPFEGGSARRYATAERPAFGDLDDRLLDGLAEHISRARTLLDVGCGPATFAARVRARHPAVAVIAVDPSRTFTARGNGSGNGNGNGDGDGDGDGDGVMLVRAAGEALPIATGAIEIAMSLSSIRHVRDRAATMRELRRVVAPGGVAIVVELDPAAEPRRVAAHADRLGSALLRHAFAPLVLRTAPPAAAIDELAARAGFTRRTLRADPIQPVYILELA